MPARPVESVRQPDCVQAGTGSTSPFRRAKARTYPSFSRRFQLWTSCMSDIVLVDESKACKTHDFLTSTTF